MTGHDGLSLVELLHCAEPDVDRIINTFITRFNAVYGMPETDCWDISKEDWNRYEFLGDSVLKLIVAQSLFTQREGVLDEGMMTRILGSVVSNPALDRLTNRYGKETFVRLIPREIAEQGTYGERITAGAFEAFLGALYCEVGLDDVIFFVNAIMGDALNAYNPDENAIGSLQEFFQKKYKLVPCYRQTKRTGPDHKPVFTYEVLFDNQVLGKGTGETIQQAQQEAARQALDHIRNSR
jgi:ribonuclease III